MSRFTTGIIVGGLIGMAGLTMAMSDRRARRMVVNDSRIMRKGANKILDKIDDMM